MYDGTQKKSTKLKIIFFHKETTNTLISKYNKCIFLFVKKHQIKNVLFQKCAI